MSVGVDVSTLRMQIKDLTADISDLDREASRGYLTVYRLTTQMNRMGLPQNIHDALDFMYSVERVVNALRMAYIALQAARMAAGDPIAWVQFGATAIASGMGIYAEVERRSTEW